MPSAFLSSGIILGMMISPLLAAAPVTQSSQSGKGTLTVISNQVANGSLPKGATNVPVLFLRLSASCDADIQVSSLTVLDRGLGASNDIRSLSLTEDAKRIGRSKSLDSSTHSAHFTLPSSFTIKRCTERARMLTATIERDALTSGERGVQLTTLTSSAKQMTFSEEDGESSSLIIRPKTAGQIRVQFLSTRERLSYGRRDTVARIQMSADAVSDHIIDSILLTNEEDARDANVENLALDTRTGQPLTLYKKSMKGREVLLHFDPPFVLERSQTVVLLLKADMKSSSRKVRFIIKEEGDIKARETRQRQ